MLELDPEFDTARRYLGDARLRHAELLGHDPAEPTSEAEERLAAGRRHLRARDYALGYRLLEQARTAGADSPECDRLLGDALLAQGELRAATAAYRRALGKGPEGVRAHAGLARVHTREGKFDLAKYHLRLFLELLRSEPTIGALEEADGEQALEVVQALAAKQGSKRDGEPEKPPAEARP